MTATGQNVWEKLWGWEALLAVSVLVPAVFGLISGYPTRERIIAASCLLAMLPLYLFLGRPAIVADKQTRGMIYIGLLVALFSPSVLLFPECTFTLFGLCSQCFLALSAKRAMVGVVALSVAPSIRIFTMSSELGAYFNLIVVITTVIFFSAVFGFWIEKITAQSQERATLIEQLESTRAEVSRLSAERGAQEERERLAGEIHDTLAQGFTSIIMLVQAAQTGPDPSRHLALAVRTAKENLAEARALISALTPAPLDSSTLVEAVRRVADRAGDELDLRMEVQVSGEARSLPTHADVVLIRALQEGLANVRKHAAATSVLVSLEYDEQDVRLRVVDDGVGFSCADGYGLSTMRSRVEQAGGSVAVRSAPGEGTTLAVEVPA